MSTTVPAVAPPPTTVVTVVATTIISVVVSGSLDVVDGDASICSGGGGKVGENRDDGENECVGLSVSEDENGYDGVK